MSPTVEAKNITQKFDNAVVLSDISCSFVGAGINIIMGPSGCGKSTLMRLFGGVRPVGSPTSGTILIDEVPCIGPHEDVVTVFQNYANRPDQTVYENIEFPFHLKLWRGKFTVPEKQEKIAAIIKTVGLENHQKLLPRQLSGGQNQRVAIARAMVIPPRILLMDEPFGALDPFTRMSMQKMLLEINRIYNCMIFFITHDIEEAFAVGTKIIVLSERPAKISRIIDINKTTDINLNKKEIWHLLAQKEQR